MIQEKAKDISMGTTIMAVAYDKGVIMGADTRTSSGSYVANRCSPKVTQINPHIFVCRSGTTSHTQYIAAQVAQYVAMQQQTRETEYCPVGVAASVAAKLQYYNKDRLSAGLIVGGWDPDNGGQVFEVPPSGFIKQVPYALSGSGSVYVYGLIQKLWRQNLDKEGAIGIVKKCVAHAIGRDGSSGGCIRTVTVEKDLVRVDITRGEDVEVTYGDLPYPKPLKASDVMETDDSTQQDSSKPKYSPVQWVK